MGVRGPLPKKGSQRWCNGMRETHASSAPAEIGTVEMPAELLKHPVAVQFWKDTAPALIADGRLRPTGVEPFALLCKLRAEVDHAERRVESEGGPISDATGKITPAAQLLRQHRRDFVELAKQFACTAMSSARMPATDAPALSDDERLLQSFIG